MAEHIFTKKDLIARLENVITKTLGEIDNKSIFERVQQFEHQKGIAGTVIEQCVFGYNPDSKQAPDLLVVDGEKTIKTELKTTGMVIDDKSVNRYVAKEPMSITAVGVYDIAEQEFFTSHFWEKLEHLLIVYYHYASKKAVSAVEYKNFRVIGYEFHEFSADDTEVLKNDWENVKKLCEEIVSEFHGPKNSEWKNLVKAKYIEIHGRLRSVLSFIDLAPKFPPRFRLKKPTVSTIIANHFGYNLEQLPGRYTAVSDIDEKCKLLTKKYKGRTIASLADEFCIPYNRFNENKGITEQIIVSMFGGTSKKINKIELFKKFGLIAKSIVVTSQGEHTEDMKLFKVDFADITKKTIVDENGIERPYTFEDSQLYAYFADYEFLCIIFEEKKSHDEEQSLKGDSETYHKLGDNKFVGFKRLVFSDKFIDEIVKPVWEDTRNKVLTGTLVDVLQYKKDGSVTINKSGDVSSAPNFIKSKDNGVFLRGAGINSSLKYKTECVNGIKMLPQYIWIKGTTIVDALKEIALL